MRDLVLKGALAAAVFSPMTFDLVQSVLGKMLKIVDSKGRPNMVGLVLHAVVFVVALQVLKRTVEPFDRAAARDDCRNSRHFLNMNRQMKQAHKEGKPEKVEQLKKVRNDGYLRCMQKKRFEAMKETHTPKYGMSSTKSFTSMFRR